MVSLSNSDSRNRNRHSHRKSEKKNITSPEIAKIQVTFFLLFPFHWKAETSCNVIWSPEGENIRKNPRSLPFEFQTLKTRFAAVPK